jgi:hypothetical protein
VECAFENARKIAGPIDTIDAFAERAVDLQLARVVVKIDFLMRMPPVEV